MKTKKYYYRILSHIKTAEEIGEIASIKGYAILLPKMPHKKALELLGEEIYMKNVCWSEDRIVNFALFKVANSFKFINHYGIIHRRYRFSYGNYINKEKIGKIINDEFVNVLSKFKISCNKSV